MLRCSVRGWGWIRSMPCSWLWLWKRNSETVVPDAATGSKVFASVRSMAAFISENGK